MLYLRLFCNQIANSVEILFVSVCDGWISNFIDFQMKIVWQNVFSRLAVTFLRMLYIVGIVRLLFRFGGYFSALSCFPCRLERPQIPRGALESSIDIYAGVWSFLCGCCSVTVLLESIKVHAIYQNSCQSLLAIKMYIKACKVSFINYHLNNN